jgi:hypothetical protein
MEHIYNNSNFGENWFTYHNLYSTIVKLSPNNAHFVEVGCWKGKSASYLLVEIINSGKNIKLDCIDLWSKDQNYHEDLSNLFEIFLNNMIPFEGLYKPIRMDSVLASNLYENNSLDFVFIDACHTYECVRNDIRAWLPKIKKNGYLCGHDFSSTDVSKAVYEYLNNISSQEDCWIYKNT